jgi:hypothetical protein
MSLNIKNATYREEEVGRFIKISKIRYVWEFCLDDVFHRVEMIDSKLSSKKMIVLDGVIIGKQDYVKTYTKYFYIDKHECVILPYWKKYELKIDGCMFNQFVHQNHNNNNTTYTPLNNQLVPSPKINRYSYSSENNRKFKSFMYPNISEGNFHYNNTSYECLIDDND